jgi:hypothetical protein
MKWLHPGKEGDAAPCVNQKARLAVPNERPGFSTRHADTAYQWNGWRRRLCYAPQRAEVSNGKYCRTRGLSDLSFHIFLLQSGGAQQSTSV